MSGSSVVTLTSPDDLQMTSLDMTSDVKCRSCHRRLTAVMSEQNNNVSNVKSSDPVTLVDIDLRWRVPTFVTVNLVCFVGVVTAVFLSAWYMFSPWINNVGCNTPGVVVKNWLPTLSAVASVQPQRYILRYSASFTYIPSCMLVGLSWWHMLSRRQAVVQPGWRLKLYRFYLKLEIVNLAGMVLGFLATNYIMNIEVFFWHAMGTWCYSVFGSSHMCTVAMLYWMSGESFKKNHSFRIKAVISIANMVFMPCMLLVFRLHMRSCLENAHSWFCVFEWVGFYIHQIFHLTAVYDFKHFQLVLGRSVVSHPTKDV